MKAMIVDDEPLALDVLETYISRLNNVELVKRCEDPIEAFTYVQENDVDVVFLDIQMPQLTGLEFVKSLKNPPLVIFTTAYSDYALEGFELDVVDYLLKPISFDRFLKAVDKAATKLGSSEEDAQEGEDFTFVKSDKKLVKVFYKDIQYIEGLKDYVIIKLDEGRVITLQTMKSLEQKLPQGQFMRVHRSYIANIDQVEAVVGNMLEIKGKHVPIGKNYREQVLSIVNKNIL